MFSTMNFVTAGLLSVQLLAGVVDAAPSAPRHDSTLAKRIPGTMTIQATAADYWEYRACWWDPNVNLYSYGFTSTSMTVETCTSTCKSKGYIVAGLENGNMCFCGNSYPANYQIDQAHCQYSPCTGNKNVPCGGVTAAALYVYNSNSASSASAAASQSASAAAAASLSASQAASASVAASLSASQSLSASAAASLSASQAASASAAASLSASRSASAYLAASQSASLAASQSAAAAASVAASQSVSASIAASISASASAANASSVSASLAASRSVSASVAASLSASQSQAAYISASAANASYAASIAASQSVSASVAASLSASAAYASASAANASIAASIAASQSVSASVAASISASAAYASASAANASIAASIAASQSVSASIAASISASAAYASASAANASIAASIAASQSVSASVAASVSASLAASQSVSASVASSLAASASAASASAAAALATTVPTPWVAASAPCIAEGTTGRALTGSSTAGQSMTYNQCLTFCANGGFAIAGLEYSGECYCGNALVNGASLSLTSSQCNMPCSGSPSTICGGPNALTLFTVPSKTAGLASDLTRAVAALPSGWSAASTACIQEGTSGRALTGAATSGSSMTVNQCISYCTGQGFGIAGVEYGGECYCGSSLTNGASLSIASNQCNMPCSGDSLSTCGGPSALSLFTNPSIKSAATSMTAPTSLPSGWSAASTTCIQEVSGRALTGASTSGGSMTVSTCLAFCQNKGFQYAGVEFGGECYCGASLVNGASLNSVSGQCNMPCNGDSTTTCGGPNAIQLYTNPSNAVVTPVSPPVNGYSAQGCIQEVAGRALTGKVLVDSQNMTIDMCTSACSAGGFKYAGVEYGGECYCGNTLDNGSNPPAVSGQCVMPCPGNSAQMCGGPNAIQLYSM